MTVESWAIILVILVMDFMFLRAGKKAYALLCLPLIAVPVLFIAGRLAVPLFVGTIGRTALLCGASAVGLLVGLGLCFLLSRRIPNRQGRNGYLAFVGIFQIALTGAYFLNLLR